MLTLLRIYLAGRAQDLASFAEALAAADSVKYEELILLLQEEVENTAQAADWLKFDERICREPEFQVHGQLIEALLQIQQSCNSSPVIEAFSSMLGVYREQPRTLFINPNCSHWLAQLNQSWYIEFVPSYSEELESELDRGGQLAFQPPIGTYLVDTSLLQSYLEEVH